MTGPDHVPTVAQRFGFRGRALSLLGAVWVLVGLAIAFQPIHDPNHLLILEHIPVALRVAAWCGAGVVAGITAWWPAGADRYGFMALVIPATIRAGAFGWTALLGTLTDGDVGKASAWVAAVSWAVVVAFIALVLAPWPEPGELRKDMQ